MENGIVKSVGQIQEGNGKYFVEIGLRGGEKAMAIADTIEEISSYRRYDRVRYSGVVTKKEVKIFVNMSNDGTSDSDARQLSITRQSCLKAAIETANISSPKGRWVDKDGVIDWGVAAKEIIAGAELYMDYVNLEDLYN